MLPAFLQEGTEAGNEEAVTSGQVPKLYIGGFEEMLADLKVACSSNPGEEDGQNEGHSSNCAELMEKLRHNSYFDALRSVLDGEKQQIGQIANQLANSLKLLIEQIGEQQMGEDEEGEGQNSGQLGGEGPEELANEEEGEEGGEAEGEGHSLQNAGVPTVQTVEQKMEECRAFCHSEGEAEDVAEGLKAKMRECLAEYRRIELLVEQNANFCVEQCRQLLAQHAQLRPIGREDMDRFETGIRLSAQLWRDHLRDLVCSNLLLLKALGAGERKKRQNFSPQIIGILNQYFTQHLNLPYPDEPTKLALAKECGITLAQVSNWFGNKRIRFRKAQQLKAQKRERKGEN